MDESPSSNIGIAESNDNDNNSNSNDNNDVVDQEQNVDKEAKGTTTAATENVVDTVAAPPSSTSSTASTAAGTTTTTENIEGAIEEDNDFGTNDYDDDENEHGDNDKHSNEEEEHKDVDDDGDKKNITNRTVAATTSYGIEEKISRIAHCILACARSSTSSGDEDEDDEEKVKKGEAFKIMNELFDQFDDLSGPPPEDLIKEYMEIEGGVPGVFLSLLLRGGQPIVFYFSILQIINNLVHAEVDNEYPMAKLFYRAKGMMTRRQRQQRNSSNESEDVSSSEPTWMETFLHHVVEHFRQYGALHVYAMVGIIKGILRFGGFETPEEKVQFILKENIIGILDSFMEQFDDMARTGQYGGQDDDDNDDDDDVDFSDEQTVTMVYKGIYQTFFAVGGGIPRTMFLKDHPFVQHVNNSLLYFPHDDMIQHTGKAILEAILGEENARQLIDHKNFHHCTEADCSGCA